MRIVKMARRPSLKPKHVAHTKTGQKRSLSHLTAEEMDAERNKVVSQFAAYVPAVPPPHARKIGRPTSYRPEYCQVVIDDAALGHTLGATCALIGISREAMTEWISVHPEFGTAVARAKSLRQRTYEGHLIDMVRRGGDSTRMSAVKLGLLNVGAEDWKERLTADHNVTFSLGDLIRESMKLVDAPKVETIEGELVPPSSTTPSEQEGD